VHSRRAAPAPEMPPGERKAHDIILSGIHVHHTVRFGKTLCPGPAAGSGLSSTSREASTTARSRQGSAALPLQKSGNESVSESGVTWVSGCAKRRCGRTLDRAPGGGRRRHRAAAALPLQARARGAAARGAGGATGCGPVVSSRCNLLFSGFFRNAKSSRSSTSH
jgi:hypothetical protein